MTKQLKEIAIPFGAKDSELCGWEYTIPEGMEATIVDNKIVVKKKESEDEKMKRIISDILLIDNDDIREILESNNVLMQDIDAWLEKQGAKVSAIEGFETEFERQVSYLIASVINKEYEFNQGYVKWTANALLNYAKHELEKHDEQKTVDKIAKEVCKDKTSAVAFLKLTGIMNENGELADEYKINEDNVEPKFKVGNWV